VDFLQVLLMVSSEAQPERLAHGRLDRIRMVASDVVTVRIDLRFLQHAVADKG
jgi:hypothetical protein